jgi:hypothetical protein
MILTAVKLYNASTVSTVRQSLLGAEFTPKESDDKARQMKVRRRVIKRNDASNGSTTTRARPSAIDAVSHCQRRPCHPLQCCHPLWSFHLQN